MERPWCNPESSPSDLARLSPETDPQDAHHEQDLRFSRHLDDNPRYDAWGRTLIPSAFREDDPGPGNRGISLEARRRSIVFQLEKYLYYVAEVRHAGIEPKNLLSGLVITDTGPNAPPQDFWRLIVIRDRFISQANALLQEMRHERTALSAHFCRKSGLSIALVSIPSMLYLYNHQCITQGIITPLLGLPASIWRKFMSPVRSTGALLVTGGATSTSLHPYVIAVGLLPFIYTTLNFGKVYAASRCISILESVIERATNWELDEQDKDELERFTCWFGVVA